MSVPHPADDIVESTQTFITVAKGFFIWQIVCVGIAGIHIPDVVIGKPFINFNHDTYIGHKYVAIFGFLPMAVVPFIETILFVKV